MSNRKTRTLSVRVTKEMLADWQAQAQAEGLSLSQWVTFKCKGIILVRPAKAA